jgi:hypothetical protein
MVNNDLMYDHILARLNRNILVETDGKKYRLRILEGEVSESQPYVDAERNPHSRLYREENKARDATEMLFRKCESVSWYVYSPAPPCPLPIRQNRRHAEVQGGTGNCEDALGQSRIAAWLEGKAD